MDIYLICLIVGGGLFALSLLGGHDGALGGHDGLADHGGLADHSLADHGLDAEHPGSGDVASWFNLRSLVSFVAFFGLAGVLGGLAGVGGGMQLVMALVSGLALGGFTAFAFRLARRSGEVSSGAGRLSGRTGQVVIPPAAGRPGRVAVTVAGQTRQASATSPDTLRPGDRVLVIAESRGVLEVKAWDGD